jgi:hypothetical protein
VALCDTYRRLKLNWEKPRRTREVTANEPLRSLIKPLNRYRTANSIMSNANEISKSIRR